MRLIYTPSCSTCGSNLTRNSTGGYICTSCGSKPLMTTEEARQQDEEIKRDEAFLSEGMTLLDAARQALWDLEQWVKDHPAQCPCFTCMDTIPDLRRHLG